MSARAFERYAAVAESVWIGVMPEADGGQAADGDEDGATHSLAHITMSDLRSAVRDVAGDHVMSIDYVAAQALPQGARAPFEAQLDEASRLVAMLAEADGQALTLSVSVEGAAGSGAMQVASAALLEHAGAFLRVGSCIILTPARRCCCTVHHPTPGVHTRAHGLVAQGCTADGREGCRAGTEGMERRNTRA